MTIPGPTAALECPDDLAQFLIERGLARPGMTRRSVIPSITADDIAAVTTIITLLQGPLTVIQLRDWLRRRGETRKGIGRLRASGPAGHFDVELTPDSDLDTMANQMIRILFGMSKNETKPAEEEPFLDGFAP